MSSLEARSAASDLAARINAGILQELARGVRPWRKPWDGARVHGPPLPPRRFNGLNYRGANVILLWSAAAARAYASPVWLSARRAARLRGRVRDGEAGALVVYHGQAIKTARDQSGAERERPIRFLKSYLVYNVAQIEGLPDALYARPLLTAPKADDIAAIEAWFAKLEIGRIPLRDTACYIPSRDVIGMPHPRAFDSAADWAATLLHECVHATMAPHRCDRRFEGRFSAHKLAMEELTAEIGAAMLCAHLGAHLGAAPNHLSDHAAYIQSWMAALRHDPRAFFTAAAKAQQAVDWLLAKSPPDQFDVAA